MQGSISRVGSGARFFRAWPHVVADSWGFRFATSSSGPISVNLAAFWAVPCPEGASRGLGARAIVPKGQEALARAFVPNGLNSSAPGFQPRRTRPNKRTALKAKRASDCMGLILLNLTPFQGD